MFISLWVLIRLVIAGGVYSIQVDKRTRGLRIELETTRNELETMAASRDSYREELNSIKRGASND